MIPSGMGEKELSNWIKPRLEVIGESITATPLDDSLKAAIARELETAGLMDPNDSSRTVGCFVRSDTNVEDLENFNGAGLNLTIFNLVFAGGNLRGCQTCLGFTISISFVLLAPDPD